MYDAALLYCVIMIKKKKKILDFLGGSGRCSIVCNYLSAGSWDVYVKTQGIHSRYGSWPDPIRSPRNCQLSMRFATFSLYSFIPYHKEISTVILTRRFIGWLVHLEYSLLVLSNE